MRQRGMTLIEVLVIVCVIGILSVIIIPWGLCHLEKARNVRLVGNVKQAAVMVEQYMIDNTLPPKTLADAYANANMPMPSGLKYCSGYWSDDNKGHGNDCDFYDEDNPGGSNPGEKAGTAGLKYIIRTDPLACRCTDLHFIWVAADPTVMVVKRGEWKGQLPGRFGGKS